jgi:hypothetical protein
MNDDRKLGLAQIGLRALIDEATGYQEVRPDNDLREYAASVGIGDLAEIIAERIALALSIKRRDIPRAVLVGDANTATKEQTPMKDPRLLICSNCGKPFSDHCRRHFFSNHCRGECAKPDGKCWDARDASRPDGTDTA